MESGVEIIFFIIIGFLLAFLILYMYWQSYQYKLNYLTLYPLHFPITADGMRIVFISDIHRRKIPEKIIQDLRNFKIDYVFIGGDLTEKGVPSSRVEQNLEMLTSLAPTYFVWGNHDIQFGKERLMNILSKYNVNVLENEAVMLQDHATSPVWLIGVGDKCNNEDDLEGALRVIPQHDDCKILLCHVPTITKKIKLENHISLVLSGHTHGGQIALPWIGPITGATGEWFPKQVVGYHELPSTTIYISSGFGTSHYPLRLCTTPEIAVITLKSPQSDC